MKKLFYMAFCLTVAMSLGCIALTYPTITDNAGNGPVVVNTNGKAHLIETAQTSQTIGGRTWEHVAFVDQGPGSNQKLTGYNLELNGLQFHSDTYCNPDWTGCAWVTNSYNPATVPCSFGAPGVKLNLNCLNISAIGVCFGYRPGECGRALKSPELSSTDLKQLLDTGVAMGSSKLVYTLSSVNTQITLTSPGGSVKPFNFAGTYEVTANLSRGNMNLDLNSIIHEQNLLKLASTADSEFANGSAHINFNGVVKDVNYGLLPGDFYRKVARNM